MGLTDASLTNRPGDLQPRSDGFFVTLSYLFRAGVPRRSMSGAERAETMLAARGDGYGRATTYTEFDAPPPYAT